VQPAALDALGPKTRIVANTHVILKDKNTEEVFSRIKPEVGHLRIFGYHVYIHVPKEKWTKMEPSGKKGVFLGYNEKSKAYRIYVPG
jgi:hypothetical protein